MEKARGAEGLQRRVPVALKRRFNLSNIFNFYGFVEQIGSVFIEGPDGLLYPPNFTDVIVQEAA